MTLVIVIVAHVRTEQLHAVSSECTIHGLLWAREVTHCGAHVGIRWKYRRAHNRMQISVRWATATLDVKERLNENTRFSTKVPSFKWSRQFSYTLTDFSDFVISCPSELHPNSGIRNLLPIQTFIKFRVSAVLVAYGQPLLQSVLITSMKVGVFPRQAAPSSAMW